MLNETGLSVRVSEQCHWESLSVSHYGPKRFVKYKTEYPERD